MEKKSIREAQTFGEEKFTKNMLYQTDTHHAFVLNFKPGQELPAHKHPGRELYLLVIEGEGTLTIDGTPAAIVQGDAVQCMGDELFAFKNTSNGNTSLYVVLGKAAGSNA